MQVEGWGEGGVNATLFATLRFFSGLFVLSFRQRTGPEKEPRSNHIEGLSFPGRHPPGGF